MVRYNLAVSPIDGNMARLVEGEEFSPDKLNAYLADPSKTSDTLISIDIYIYNVCKETDVADVAQLLDTICQQGIIHCNLTIYSEKKAFKAIIPTLATKLHTGLPLGFQLTISGTTSPRGLNIGDLKKMIHIIQKSKSLPDYFGFKIDSFELPSDVTKQLTNLMKSGHLPKGSSIKLKYHPTNGERLNETVTLFRNALTSAHTKKKYHVDVQVCGQAFGTTNLISQIGLTSIITEENLPDGFRIDIYVSPAEVDQVCDYISNIKTKKPIQLRLHGVVSALAVSKLGLSLRNAALVAGSVINLAALKPLNMIEGMRLFYELMVVNKNVTPITIILPIYNLLTNSIRIQSPVGFIDAYINHILRHLREGRVNPQITLSFDENAHYPNHFLTLYNNLSFGPYQRGTTLLCNGLLQYLPMLADIKLPFLTHDAYQKLNAYKNLIMLKKLSSTITDTQLGLAVMRCEIERVSKLFNLYTPDGKPLIQVFLSDTAETKKHILDVTALSPVKPLKLLAAQACLLLLRTVSTHYTQTDRLAKFQELLRIIPDDVSKILHDTQSANSILYPEVTSSFNQPLTFFYDRPLKNKRAHEKEQDSDDENQKRPKR